MYWPSVQDDCSLVSPLARGLVACATPRLFSRSSVFEMKGLGDEPAVPVVKAMSAFIQPVTDSITQPFLMAKAKLNKSAIASVLCHTTDRNQHKEPRCTR